MASLRDLQDQRNRAWERAKEINEAAAGRQFSAEEKANWDAANADIDKYGELIERDFKVGTLGDYLKNSATPAVTEAIRGAVDPDRETRDSREKREATKEERALWHEYLRDGTIRGVPQMRALQSDADSAGGFTVPLQNFQSQIIQQVHDNVYIYAQSNNFTVDRAESLGVPVLSAQLGIPTWGTELAVGTADSAMQFGKRELRPHPLAGNILVSKKLLRQSGIDVEALVRDQIAYKTGVAIEQALLNGFGANGPLGIFSTGTNQVISTGTDVTASSSNTCAGCTDLADNFISMKYSLKQQYWNRAVWVINRQHAVYLRQLKDQNGQYLFTPGYNSALQSGSEVTDGFLGRPLLMSEYAPLSSGVGGSSAQSPSVTGNSTGTLISGYTAAFFDPSQIWTAQALSLSIQHLVELKAETNQDEFIYRMEMDGMPVLAEAFSRLRLKGF